jgi:hypothetical protein
MCQRARSATTCFSDGDGFCRGSFGDKCHRVWLVWCTCPAHIGSLSHRTLLRHRIFVTDHNSLVSKNVVHMQLENESCQCMSMTRLVLVLASDLCWSTIIAMATVSGRLVLVLVLHRSFQDSLMGPPTCAAMFHCDDSQVDEINYSICQYRKSCQTHEELNVLVSKFNKKNNIKSVVFGFYV